MTTLEIRNLRGVVVCTTNLPELAFRFIRERQDLGKLEVYRVTTTVVSERLEPATVTQLRPRRAR
jgi:hypothetical protein